MAMMPRLIAFDPGARSVAWASFEDGKLTRCGLERDKNLGAALERRFRGIAARVVIELPQIYGRRDERDPNDLIMVTVTVGRIVQVFGGDAQPAELVWPHDWKGTVPKEIMLKRIVARLDENEREILEAANAPRSLRHNVIDAAGLGIWALGRG
jgi:hypothetical protein